ncbi:uncharacterized protein LOC106177249 [Lingula anatina]|uniref:Uncharacterized protein LOC106177249 n=1 Tax=Lingula anatina TaxID=7574 RepID=A0A1S3JYD6_LINAN|nr:uncharacterized protein LOC106177249 [Lingula anatina]|eukprot:XP_013415425.1 uncharacterized protein LOC106177249 [Lingula anatina]
MQTQYISLRLSTMHGTLTVVLLTACIIMMSLLMSSNFTLREPVCETVPKRQAYKVLNTRFQGKHHRQPSARRFDAQITSADMFEDLGSSQINATDPRLLKLLRQKWLLAPSSRPFHLANPEKVHASQIEQSQVVDRLLEQRTNGFFVEAGAANGEIFSNSLFFERFRNWTGLLVEADPWSFHDMAGKHRKSYIINSCLSLGPHPERTEFTFARELGGISQTAYVIPTNEQSTLRGKGLPRCFPIHSILAALGVTHVDYFSLDVEGAEVEILKTFPWEDITVDVWSIEYAVHGGGGDTPKRLQAIREIFQMTGAYVEVDFPKGQDVLFARKEILGK